MLPPPKPNTSTERSFVLPEGCTEMLHLMGVSGLADFLTFAREHTNLAALSGAGDESVMMELAESWRDAARTFEGLEATDPYPAEPPMVFPIPGSMRVHCEQLLAQPKVQREFDRVPIALGMVPLAQLVCAEQRIAVHPGTVDVAAKAHLSDEALVEACLPLQPRSRSLCVTEQAMREGKNEGSVTFTSEVDEPRLLSPQLLDGELLATAIRGNVGQIVGLPVGFAANFFNVIRFEGRMLLNNGHSLANAMYARGMTHVPAVIQVCRHWEDLGLIASPEVVTNRHAYFEHSRPPLLKDFSDRRVAITLAIPIMRKFVRIKYQIETGYFNG